MTMLLCSLFAHVGICTCFIDDVRPTISALSISTLVPGHTFGVILILQATLDLLLSTTLAPLKDTDFLWPSFSMASAKLLFSFSIIWYKPQL